MRGNLILDAIEGQESSESNSILVRSMSFHEYKQKSALPEQRERCNVLVCTMLRGERSVQASGDMGWLVRPFPLGTSLLYVRCSLYEVPRADTVLSTDRVDCRPMELEGMEG